MTPSRRQILAQLGVLAAAPLHFRFGDASDTPQMIESPTAADPLAGTIAEFQAGRRRSEWTSEQVTRRALERSESTGKRLRAVDALDKRALEDARASDARAKRGALRGPLDGVPVFAKSIYDMRGLPTTASSAEWARLYPDYVTRDALEVQRLRAAGAVVIGKTAADDFAYRGNGTSSHTGQVLNPYDATGTRTPGGSSAGSAVAVATGMAFAALGTDDGGSNRIPAGFTGVVGMKPTFGLVPRTGVIPTWPYLDTHGPLARTVADAALLLSAISGPDASDPLALTSAFDAAPLRTLRGDALRGVRLGIVTSHVPREGMTEEALATWDRAVNDLRAAGATVEPFEAAVTRVNYRDLFTASAAARGDVKVNANSPAPTANALLRYFEGRSANANEARAMMRRGYPAFRAFYDVLPATFEECDPLLVQPMDRDAAGRSFAASRADAVAQLAASMRAANVTAMVYPTMPFSAPLAAGKWPDVRTPLGYGNWLGLPEVSVPAGVGSDGMMALNLSVTGLPGDDARVLNYAHAYEQQARRFVMAPA